MKGRRIVWPAARRVEIEDFELPAVGPGAVLIETEYSVISPGTETAWLLALPNTSGRFPQHPGYSGAGRIVEVGADVQGLHAGDRVLADHAGHASHAVKPAAGVVRIEDDAVPGAEAAFVVIASMSLQGVRKARLELGESVLVMGQGLLGLFATQLARLSGGLPVIALDLDDQRRRLAEALGADRALSPQAPDFHDTLQSLTRGRGANVVIEVTGSPEAMKLALACAARQGRVSALGCARGLTDGVDFYNDVHRKGVSIIGAHNFIRPARDSSPGYWTTQDDLRTLLDLLATGRLRVGPMISEQVAPEQAPDIYRRLIERDRALLGVVLDWRTRGSQDASACAR